MKWQSFSKTKNYKQVSVGLCDFKSKKTELDYVSYAKE